MDHGSHRGGHWYVTYLGTVGGLHRTNWDYPWDGEAVPCRGQLVPVLELLRGVLGKVRAERGGEEGRQSAGSGSGQVPAFGVNVTGGVRWGCGRGYSRTLV